MDEAGSFSDEFDDEVAVGPEEGSRAFFGRDVLLPSAHVALSLRTGAPLIPAFSGRDGAQLTASFEPPLELESTGDRDADVREGMRRWARVLERYIRRAPEQWTVFERVWPGRG